MQNLVKPITLVFLLSCLMACNGYVSDEREEGDRSMAASGHEQMVAILDSIARTADPKLNYHLNTKRAELYKRQFGQGSPQQQVLTMFKYGEQLLYAGKTEAAIVQFQQAVEVIGDRLYEQSKKIYEMLALSYLRLGEQENCILQHNAESCLLPIRGQGVYRNKTGLEEAISIYKRILETFPGDLQSRWLLNIAYMNLGEYPEGVPADYLIPENIFTSSGQQKFVDIAIPLGLDVQGLSGGVCMEDFDNDGNLDLFMTSYGLTDQVRYFRNNGDGTFSDRTSAAHLDGIVSGLNTLHADYDNDGDRDIFILRGGWLAGGTHPNSLLRNNGDGTFTDVTKSAGLLSFHPTQTAAWADYDGDGWLDLYIANETMPGKTVHRNELYHNNGNGTFTDVASKLQVDFQGFFKGCSWGDVNNDRLPDLYLSNMSGDNKLLVNRGNGQFEDIAPAAGVTRPAKSFPTWFFDFNNDGRDDILVAGYNVDEQNAAAGELLREYLGQLPEGDWFRLYENRGDEKFADVTKQAGMQRITYAMGSNFGDLDNDGWKDFYLGTGKPDLRSLMPNRMFRNVRGKRFEEVTMDGFAHIQKGHGIAFGDLDNDGDQDIYAVMGGAYEGDISNNLLFENPGRDGHHWITIELEGKRCNRDAIGSKIAVHVRKEGGGAQVIWTTVNTGGSFGSASLRQEIGLGAADRIEKVEVYWAQPGPALSIYNEVPMDAMLRIVEGEDEVKVVERPQIKFQITE